MLHTVCVRLTETQGTAEAIVQQQQRFHTSTLTPMSQEGQACTAWQKKVAARPGPDLLVAQLACKVKGGLGEELGQGLVQVKHQQHHIS